SFAPCLSFFFAASFKFCLWVSSFWRWLILSARSIDFLTAWYCSSASLYSPRSWLRDFLTSSCFILSASNRSDSITVSSWCFWLSSASSWIFAWNSSASWLALATSSRSLRIFLAAVTWISRTRIFIIKRFSSSLPNGADCTCHSSCCSSCSAVTDWRSFGAVFWTVFSFVMFCFALSLRLSRVFLSALTVSLSSSRVFRLSWSSVRVVSSLLLTSDRKSTRLNSSHVSISYAVFCLKKKKKNNSNHFIILIT